MVEKLLKQAIHLLKEAHFYDYTEKIDSKVLIDDIRCYLRDLEEDDDNKIKLFIELEGMEKIMEDIKELEESMESIRKMFV